MSRQISRRQFLQIASIGIGSTLLPTLSCTTQTKKHRTPNIILIMADDFGYECLSCNGSKSYQTPHLDQLAVTGIRFTHCHSTPLCTPTRVQLMTGQYNFRNYTQFGSLPPDSYTFAHILQYAGYRTCVVGKWQLAGNLNKDTRHKGQGMLPEAAGFQEHCLWQVHERQARYWAPLLEINGERKQFEASLYGPDIFCDYLLDFINRNKDRAFFVYYPMVLTHDPFVPTPDSDCPPPPDERNANKHTKYFADMVAYTDKIVGKIVRQVDACGIRENTLIIFVGDNGTHPSITTDTATGPVQGAKGHMVMAGTHVPFIANWKGNVPAGVVSDALVDFTDFLPTFLELSQGVMPTGVSMDGFNLLPELTGNGTHGRQWIYCSYNPRWGKHRKPGQYAMDHRFKLYGDGRLFDIVADPQELHPIDRPEQSAVTRKRLDALQHVLDSMNAQGADTFLQKTG